MKDTLLTGTLTELKCITKLIELGYNVAVPQKQTRYDFILDIGNKLLKIQVKSCNTTRKPGAIFFYTSSRRQTRTGTRKHDYSLDNIDYFCTYYNDNCYLIPISECGHDSKSLRIVPSINKQRKNISFANDYLAEKIINSLK